VAEGADEFYQAARNELEAGADHVKIFASGGLARAGEALDKTEMSQQEMAGAVRAAVERATYVVAHTATSSSIRVGLSAGVRCFEHAYMLDERTAQEMAAAGAYLTPTLVVTHVPDWMSEAGFPPDSIERSRQMAVHHMDSVATAIAAGVAIVNGTDFPPSATSDGTSLTVRELELLVAAGLTPLTALRSATTTAAQLLGLSHETARWQAGALADFVGVEENPLTSISALRRIVLVVRAGRTVSDQTPGSE
jgi:imidazolonepropionase-like amidohydrolase